MSGITRMSPSSLAGIAPVPEGTTTSRTSVDADFGGGLSAGTWSAEPQVEAIESYPVDEIMWIIEGSLILRTPDDASQEFGPGDALSIARGTALTWDQPTALTKFWVTRGSDA